MKGKTTREESFIIKECLESEIFDTKDEVLACMKKLLDEDVICARRTSSKTTLSVQNDGDDLQKEAVHDGNVNIFQATSSIIQSLENIQNDIGIIKNASKISQTEPTESSLLKCKLACKDSIIEILKDEIKCLRETKLNSYQNLDQDLIFKTFSQTVETLLSQIKHQQNIIDKLLSEPILTNNQPIIDSIQKDVEQSKDSIKSFKSPKRPIKTKNIINKSKDVPLKNRFSLLNTVEILDDSNVENNKPDAIEQNNDRTENIDVIDVKDVNDQRNKRQKTMKNEKKGNDQRNKRQKTMKNKKKEKNHQKFVSILGDSIIKELKGYELSGNDSRVIVKSFPGATTNCMKDYVKPTQKHNPDVILIHCGTNDLRRNENNEEIAENIISLATDLSDKSTVIVSGLIVRGDHLKKRITQVNTILQKKCCERNIGFVDNSNILLNHLNKSKLHLNRKGSEILSKNLEISFKN